MRQLAEFLALISSIEDDREVPQRAVERVAEIFEAEAACLLVEGQPAASVGFAPRRVPVEALVAVAAEGRERIEVGEARLCHATAATVNGGSLALIAARAELPLDRAEIELLGGIARVLSLGFRTVNLLEAERSARQQSERNAESNERLLATLRGRQALVERLSRLQRAIVDRRPTHETLAAVVEDLIEVGGADVAAIRLRDPSDRSHTTIASAAGADERLLANSGWAPATEGLGGRAMRERGLVVAGSAAEVEPRQLEVDFARTDVTRAMAAPIWELGEIVGSIAVGAYERTRDFDAREQQMLLAFAEHSSLALGHARSVADSMRGAFRDPLTGLPNRSLFLDRLEVALARAERTGTPVGVLFCDLDGFKTVNDGLGHQAGDRLLTLVAERLRTCLRPADTLARLGGDDFAVMLDELREPEDSARAAQRMLDALEAPFDLAGREIFISASIGIAAGTEGRDTLLRDADLAMHRARATGKGRYAAFEPHMHTAAVERLELEVDLKRAIEHGELVLVYQPIFDMRSGEITALEALVRWRHPTRGLVQADRFVPLAEESGHILALGRWVLREACHQAALWRARYPAVERLQVGVNISAAQLRDDTLAGEVAEALGASQLDADGLTLEVTESSLLEDSDASVGRLEELKALGVELAIDDFGTGYSSLTYLRRFPFDNLKIDRSFVAELTDSDEEPDLLRAVIDLGEIFKLRLVAEGVEHRAQCERLLRLGCDLGQGNGLSPPLVASEADALLLNAGLLGGPLARLPEPTEEQKPIATPRPPDAN